MGITLLNDDNVELRGGPSGTITTILIDNILNNSLIEGVSSNQNSSIIEHYQWIVFIFL